MSTRKLNVYLHEILVGSLSLDRYGDMLFAYEPSYLENKAHRPLSYALPLQEKSFTSQECRPFFSGILPEAQLRSSIARHLGISEKNDFALLAALGGECAGAVSLLPESSTLGDLKPDYRVLDDNKIADILETLIQKPMLAGEDGIRLSLAGAQDKLAVAVFDGRLAIPLNGAASTHILKPNNRDFPTLIENECFCLNLARTIGLNAVEASLNQAKNQTYLLVKRYDRSSQDHQIRRLHQEDFCQALGIAPEMKYQREGGPRLLDCFNLVRQVSSLPVLDIKSLLQGVLFNLLIGNNDAHGKNFSLLYQGQETRLAPFYDLISTTYYPVLAQKMAMKIGSKYEFGALFPRHIAQMAEEAGLSVALVQKELREMMVKIPAKIEESPFKEGILQRIKKLESRVPSSS